jgi:hypothetical protein
MSQITELASGAITAADTLIIELVQAGGTWLSVVVAGSPS